MRSATIDSPKADRNPVTRNIVPLYGTGGARLRLLSGMAQTLSSMMRRTPMSSGSPVESVRRAFALLEELNRQRINSVQHLHEVTALPKSTIVRMLETLRL